MPLVLSCPPVADRWSLCKAQTPMVYSGMDAGVDHRDRYWSRILEGELPEEGAEEPTPGDRPQGRTTASGDRPCWGSKKGKAGFPTFYPFLPPFPPDNRANPHPVL
jgi:hypothetical protein